MLLYGGQVQGQVGSDAVLIEGDKIGFVGRSGELFPQLSRRAECQLIDLKGRTVAPGFIDCHLHFLESAALQGRLDLRGQKRLSEVLHALHAYASELPEGVWVKAFGCDEALLEEGRGPSRDELDEAVPDKPLRLRHQTLHASWLNSRAIELLGLDDPSCATPSEGVVVRDGQGRATGLIVGLERWLSERIPRSYSNQTFWHLAHAFSRKLAQFGITTITDTGAANGVTELKLFAHLVESGALRQRLLMMLGQDAAQDFPRAFQIASRAGIEIRWIKFMPSRIATVTHWSSVLKLAVDFGLGAAFHVTELEELELALATIERCTKQGIINKAELPPLRLEHGVFIPPNYVERIAESKVWVVANPGFIYYRGKKYMQEAGLLPYLFPLRTLSEEGIPLAAGSDSPVIGADPLVGIAGAHLRQVESGEQIAPDEALSLKESYDLFTKHASELCGLAAGEIAVGKDADLIVLPKDPMCVQVSELVSIRPLMTIIRGEIVYQCPEEDCSGES